MPDLINNTLTFAAVCLIVAVGLWLMMRSARRTDQANPQQSGSQNDDSSQRASMHAGDWFNTGLNLAMGTLLGIVVADLVPLLKDNFWITVITSSILVAIFLGINGLLDSLLDKVFPSGFRSPRNPKTKRRTPLLRLVGLPIGIAFGLALALVGFGGALLELI